MLAAGRLLQQQRPFAAASRPAPPASRRTAVCVQAKVSLAGLVQDIASTQLRKDLPAIGPGDSVKVSLAVLEGNGKVRTQTLDGVIIGQHGGGIDKTVRFRRVFQGVGVELSIPVNSPILQKVEFVRRGKIRRAKLYYLRERMGKSARLQEVVGVKLDVPTAPPPTLYVAPPAEAAKKKK